MTKGQVALRAALLFAGAVVLTGLVIQLLHKRESPNRSPAKTTTSAGKKLNAFLLDLHLYRYRTLVDCPQKG